MPRFIRTLLALALGIFSVLFLIAGIVLLIQGQIGQLVTIAIALVGLWGTKKLWPTSRRNKAESLALHPDKRVQVGYPAPYPTFTTSGMPSDVVATQLHSSEENLPEPQAGYFSEPVPSSALDSWSLQPALRSSTPLTATEPPPLVSEDADGGIIPFSLQEPTFIAIDFETANESRASACAVGIARVVDRKVVHQRTWLIQPPPPYGTFRSRNISIHGITPELVNAHGKPWSQVLPELLDEINGMPLVAHNASFDMSVLEAVTRAVGLPIPNLRYDDSLELARQALPTLDNHRLPTVAQACGVTQLSHHDAGDDARVCAHITVHLLTLLNEPEGGEISTNEGSVERERDAYRGHNVDPSPAADPTHPLYGATVVITGSLSGMTRKSAQERIAALGGTARTAVSKKTTYLVQGQPTGHEATSIGSEKTLRALAMQSDGHPIQIITEEQFCALLEGEDLVSDGITPEW